MQCYHALKIAAILETVIWVGDLLAQPPVEFIRNYDTGGEDSFRDLFALADGGYAMCGSSQQPDNGLGFPMEGDVLVVRTDANGNEVWHQIFEANHRGWGASIIETDNGDLAIGGVRSWRIDALRINDEGDLIWRMDFGERICSAVIELKNGNLVFAGGTGHAAKIVCTNPNGEIIWNRTYEIERNANFIGIRETEDGLIAGGTATLVDRYLHYPIIVKVTIDEGDVVWTRFLNRDWEIMVNGMTSAGDGGFAFVGEWTDNRQGRNGPTLLKVNGVGEEIWRHYYDIGDPEDWSYSSSGICRSDAGGFALVGLRSEEGNNGPADRSFGMKTSRNGVIRWRSIYELEEDERFVADNHRLLSVVPNQNGELIAAGMVMAIHADSNTYDGLLIKLESDFLGPQFISFSPEDTSLLTLLNSDISFIAVGHSPYFDELDYTWTIEGSENEIEVRRDTLAVATFDSLGESQIQCLVEDEDASVSIRWHVTVTDLFIASHSPDTLDLTLRRGSTVDFSIDSVAAVEGDDVQYQWLRNDLDRQEESGSGEDAGVTLDFNRSGHYTVEGMAYRGESHDEVVWDVEVRGAIWSFLPEELNVETLEGENVEFQIIPTISDSLNWYTWLYDGGMIREGWDSVFVMNFFELGEHTITGVLADSVESDSVSWTVLVESNSVPPSLSLEPSAFSLSASPNPFNSMLMIRFSTGSQAAPTRLAVYDLSGREVARLLDSKSEIRNQKSEITWNAEHVPAGVYLIHLESGLSVQTMKVVLLR